MYSVQKMYHIHSIFFPQNKGSFFKPNEVQLGFKDKPMQHSQKLALEQIFYFKYPDITQRPM